MYSISFLFNKHWLSEIVQHIDSFMTVFQTWQCCVTIPRTRKLWMKKHQHWLNNMLSKLEWMSSELQSQLSSHTATSTRSSMWAPLSFPNTLIFMSFFCLVSSYLNNCFLFSHFFFFCF
jgi:hypothetical protein